MRQCVSFLIVAVVLVLTVGAAWAADQVIDVPTRPGITERFILIAPDDPRATVVLFAGDDGGLLIAPDGTLGNGWLATNFLVRSRRLFADQRLMVAVVDAPSDRQSMADTMREAWRGSFRGFRQSSAHVADIKAVIAWLRQKANVPVWLVGTSRGTESAAYVATELPPRQGGPDGLVLTATILADPKGRSVPDMELSKLEIPTLIVHHRDDDCWLCRYGSIPSLMEKLPAGRRKELLTVEGGWSRGDPCQAFAYHGFNGRESEVVAKIAAWITAK
jgi:dienelactone hydrolase